MTGKPFKRVRAMIYAGVLVLLSTYPDESGLRLSILPPAGRVEAPIQENGPDGSSYYMCADEYLL